MLQSTAAACIGEEQQSREKRMKTTKKPLGIMAAGLASALIATGAGAEGLPSSMAWTAYDVGSAGYAQAVAIGSALRNEKNVTLRVLPGKNDVSRLAPLREGRVDFSAFGIGGYQALEAAFVFGKRDWGPQRLRLLTMSNSEACNTLLFAGDLGIETYADLKGKRLPVVKGAPALNHLVYAYLRYADLDWDDVQTVEFGGYAASLDAIIENRVDGAITITTSGLATKVVAGPRGHAYAPVPHDDEEGWARLLDAAPWFYKSMCVEGAGIDEPFEAASYPYPILIAYDTQDEETVYAMTKAMYDLFPTYKDSAPGASGWALDRQIFEWVIPYHPGAIRYYQEIDKWTPEVQANQDRLLARETIITDAWNSYLETAPEQEAAFDEGWQQVRADALTAEDLNPIWTTW
jgi:TRAP transporter TAXI family solute receptor